MAKTGFNVSRRQWLIGSAAAACAGAGAIGWSASEQRRARWIEDVIRLSLPGIDIDAASLQRFVAETLASPVMQSQRRRVGLAADALLPSSVTRRVGSLQQGIDITERMVLSGFLLGSNFFRVSDPKREKIVYYGPPPACGNPFVRYG